MTLWAWLLLACAAAGAIKLAGYLVPARCLENEHMARVAGTLTIGLLAALTTMNTFSDVSGLVLDARLGAVLAAGIALWLRAPFLLVVIVGALATALIRLAGAG